jgi:hypothetical protein
MGGKNGNYRLEIVLLRRVVELLLDYDRERSDVILWIDSFRILPNRLLRSDGLGRWTP